VVAFNSFTGKIEGCHVEMNRASSQLVNCLFKIPQALVREEKLQESNPTEEVYATR
jgi:hypothetical protein